jgi:hypothetical protein
MNDLIERLAEQATIKEEYYPAGCNGYPEYRYNFDKEKFARLLILECAEVVNYYNTRNERVTPRDIKKHFGVAE